MLAVLSIASIASGTWFACGATDSRYERQIDILSGLLFVAGLSMVGTLLPVWH